MVTATGKRLIEIYNLLLSSFGPQNWWPAETALEMMVGAILTQNTSWNNVEKAILNLKGKSLLSIEKLSQVPGSILAEYIKPAGYYNLKVSRLKNLINFIVDRYDSDIYTLFSLDTWVIREELLTVKGIGLETADSIVLYGAGRPIFVVDTYTYRILTRHSLIEEEAGYDDLQLFFMDNLSHDVDLFKEFHALIVKTGKDFCKRKPRCPECPLNRLNRVYYD
jgi:endonuclease III related protein